MIELVDYSRTANADWATLAGVLKANGILGVGRYAVSDLSPGGRGISAAEYAAMRRAGLDVFLYYERDEGWMLGGYAAGVAAANDFEQNRIAAGMPPVPGHFAHDIDPQPQHFAAIDACLNGVASVMGWPRTGAYGGWLLIDYLAQGGAVKHLAQTSAWEYGRGVHPAATLYQYAYNRYYAGTNCDLVRALAADYGQASRYEKGNPVPTTPAPAPKPPAVQYPEGLDKGVCQRLFGSFKASNGVTVNYSEGDELAALWLASGRYGKIVDVAIYQDSPTATRIYWVFSSGDTYFRPNANEPIRLIKP